MKRRKFLQALGLATVAPVFVGKCSWENTRPDDVVKSGIDFSNKPDVTVIQEWEVTQVHILERHYYLPDSIIPDFVFPNKPIFPNYMTTNA